ncbi:MAG: hypothetical protein U1A78_29355 [Polyangia bacterium]
MQQSSSPPSSSSSSPSAAGAEAGGAGAPAGAQGSGGDPGGAGGSGGPSGPGGAGGGASGPAGPAPAGGGAARAGRYRVAWLVVSGIGFLLSLILLGRFIVGRRAEAPAVSMPAPSMAPAAAPSMAQGAAPGGAEGGEAGPTVALRPRADEPAAPAPSPEPVAAEGAKAPSTADREEPAKRPASPAHVAKKERTPKKPAKPSTRAPLASSRGVEAEDDADRPEAKTDAPAAAPPPPAKTPARPSAPSGMGSVGSMGHGTVAAGPKGPSTDDATPTTKKKRRSGGKGRVGAPAAEEEARETRPAVATGRVPGRGRDVGELLPGHFSYSIPPKMKLGKVEHITCTAGLRQLRALIDQELTASTPGDTGKDMKTADIPLSRLLRVELKTDNEGDFDIRSFAPNEQYLSEDSATIWKWAVTPRAEGEHNLTVVITNLNDANGKPIRVKLYAQHVVVESSVWQKTKEVLVAVSGALSGLAGVVGAWMGVLRPMLMRRREEGEYAGRGRGYGGTGFGGGGGGYGGGGGGPQPPAGGGAPLAGSSPQGGPPAAGAGPGGGTPAA